MNMVLLRPVAGGAVQYIASCLGTPADTLMLAQAHGWTLRGDDKDPKVGDAAKDAFARALKWFQQHL